MLGFVLIWDWFEWKLKQIWHDSWSRLEIVLELFLGLIWVVIEANLTWFMEYWRDCVRLFCSLYGINLLFYLQHLILEENVLQVDTRGCSQARLILWHFCELLSTFITTMGGNFHLLLLKLVKPLGMRWLSFNFPLLCLS